MNIRSQGTSRPLVLIVAVALIAAHGSVWAQQGSTLDELSQEYPGPDLAPKEVVRIQMEAFRRNDADDTGIAIAFRFASPQNKEMTGPLSRFSRMMRGPLYRAMLRADAVEYGEPLVEDGMARIEVTTVAPDGDRTYYAFYLSRQRGGEYEDAWMTEAVEVLPEGDQPPPGSV